MAPHRSREKQLVSRPMIRSAEDDTAMGLPLLTLRQGQMGLLGEEKRGRKKPGRALQCCNVGGGADTTIANRSSLVIGGGAEA
jgi:hypothetical protein